jgi:hypothetical protein
MAGPSCGPAIIRGRSGDLGPVGHPCPSGGCLLQPMNGTHNEVAGVHLIGEQLARNDLDDSHLNGSSSGGVIVNFVPTANGPSISIFSMPWFHSGHAAMSDQRRHRASAGALVSTLCSYSHMVLSLDQLS